MTITRSCSRKVAAGAVPRSPRRGTGKNGRYDTSGYNLAEIGRNMLRPYKSALPALGERPLPIKASTNPTPSQKARLALDDFGHAEERRLWVGRSL